MKYLAIFCVMLILSSLYAQEAKTHANIDGKMDEKIPKPLSQDYYCIWKICSRPLNQSSHQKYQNKVKDESKLLMESMNVEQLTENLKIQKHILWLIRWNIGILKQIKKKRTFKQNFIY